MQASRNLPKPPQISLGKSKLAEPTSSRDHPRVTAQAQPPRLQSAQSEAARREEPSPRRTWLSADPGAHPSAPLSEPSARPRWGRGARARARQCPAQDARPRRHSPFPRVRPQRRPAGTRNPHAERKSERSPPVRGTAVRGPGPARTEAPDRSARPPRGSAPYVTSGAVPRGRARWGRGRGGVAAGG